MNDDEDTTEFPGILGSYFGAQPGGILAGLFPPQPGYDPQQAAGLPAGATPATPAELAHTLRMIGYQAAALRALGQRADATQTTNTDGSPQDRGPMPSAPVAAPDDPLSGPDISGDAIAQALPAVPGNVAAARPQGSVPLPKPRPPQLWPRRMPNSPNASIPENPPWLPSDEVVKERWPRPEDADPNAFMRAIAAVPLPPPPNLPTLRKYQIDPDDLTKHIVGAEDASGDPNAKSPSSSATGLAQFRDKTWIEQIKKYRPDLAVWSSDPALLELRADPSLQRELAARYAEENASALDRARFPLNYRNIYLAHHFGATGAKNLLTAENVEPDRLARSVLSADTVRANQKVITPTTTVRDLIQWAEDRMEHGAGWRRPSR